MRLQSNVCWCSHLSAFQWLQDLFVNWLTHVTGRLVMVNLLFSMWVSQWLGVLVHSVRLPRESKKWRSQTSMLTVFCWSCRPTLAECGKRPNKDMFAKARNIEGHLEAQPAKGAVSLKHAETFTVSKRPSEDPSHDSLLSYKSKFKILSYKSHPSSVRLPSSSSRVEFLLTRRPMNMPNNQWYDRYSITSINSPRHKRDKWDAHKSQWPVEILKNSMVRNHSYYLLGIILHGSWLIPLRSWFYSLSHPSFFLWNDCCLRLSSFLILDSAYRVWGFQRSPMVLHCV